MRKWLWWAVQGAVAAVLRGSEDGEGVRPTGRDVCGFKARCDVVDDAHQLVGEDLSGSSGAAGDLVEQRG